MQIQQNIFVKIPVFSLLDCANVTYIYFSQITFTYAAGQEAPTFASRGRNARFSGAFLFLTLSFTKIYDIKKSLSIMNKPLNL